MHMEMLERLKKRLEFTLACFSPASRVIGATFAALGAMTELRDNVIGPAFPLHIMWTRLPHWGWEPWAIIALLVLFLPAFNESARRYQQQNERLADSLEALGKRRARILLPNGSQTSTSMDGAYKVWGLGPAVTVAIVSLFLIGLYFKYNPQVAFALSGDTEAANPVVVTSFDASLGTNLVTIYRGKAYQTNLAVCLRIPNDTDHTIRVERIYAEVHSGWFSWKPLMRVPQSAEGRKLYFGTMHSARPIPASDDLEALAQKPIGPHKTIKGWISFDFPRGLRLPYDPSDPALPVRIVITDDYGHRIVDYLRNDPSRSSIQMCAIPPHKDVDLSHYPTAWNRPNESAWF